MPTRVIIQDIDSGDSVELQYAPRSASMGLAARISEVQAFGQFPVTSYQGLQSRRVELPLVLLQEHDGDDPMDRLEDLERLLLPEVGKVGQRRLVVTGIGTRTLRGSIESLAPTLGPLDDDGRPRSIDLRLVFLVGAEQTVGGRHLQPVGSAV